MCGCIPVHGGGVDLKKSLSSPPPPNREGHIHLARDLIKTERESKGYRGTSLIRNSAPLGSCSRNMPRAIWLS